LAWHKYMKSNVAVKLFIYISKRFDTYGLRGEAMNLCSFLHERSSAPHQETQSSEATWERKWDLDIMLQQYDIFWVFHNISIPIEPVTSAGILTGERAAFSRQRNFDSLHLPGNMRRQKAK
jgi:hypothetical protein